MIYGIATAHGGPIHHGMVLVGDSAGVVFMPAGQVLGMVQAGDIGGLVTGVVVIGDIITTIILIIIIMVLLTVIVVVAVLPIPAVIVAADAVLTLRLTDRVDVTIIPLLCVGIMRQV